MLRVLVFIQRNLDRELALDELADVANFSPYHFHRIFRGMTGESLAAHVRRIRLERAAMRLRGSQNSVTRIAFEAGYETHQAFTRAFRAMTGMAPSHFRTQNGRLPAIGPSEVRFDPSGPPRAFSPLEMGGAAMHVSVKHVEPMRVAFMRHVGPYNEVGPVWEEFTTRMGAAGCLGGSTMFVGLCHDDPEVTPPDKVRYDCCVTVDGSFEAEGQIGVQEIAGGEYAVTTHHGPYQSLGETYAKLCGEWLPRSGRVLRAAPGFEVYLNSPEGTEPDELLTDIYMPLEPKQGGVMGTKGRAKPKAPAKIDLFKEYRDEYLAPSSPTLVTVGEVRYLAVVGRGSPGGQEFQAKVGALYGAAFTIKMTRKFAGKGDYVVGKLEGQYWGDEGPTTWSDDPERLNWRLMIRVPDVVVRRDLDDARAKLAAKGKDEGLDAVELFSEREGACVQMLHVGPYDKEAESVRTMLAFSGDQGLTYRGPHHEIYLSDPRRVAPEKLRTILRLPVG